MPSDWERGYDAGYRAALSTARRDIGSDMGPTVAVRKKVRKTNPYNTKFSKAFKSLESKYKIKSGGWAKDGFKRCQKAAHAKAKRM